MKKLLDDYRFNDILRYEAHKLYYTPSEPDTVIIEGILGAAILAAKLLDTVEGDARGIAIVTEDEQKEFFKRYEAETLHDNGGLLITEVKSLREAYINLIDDNNLLFTICGNDRLYDLAYGLMINYMTYLIRERVREHIYEAVPWTEPFAQWLFNAGFVETRRQQLLAIDWSDPAAVYAFAQQLETDPDPIIEEPTFIFDNERAEDLLSGYYNWLMTAIEQQAALFPDANVQLAELKAQVLQNELDWEFIKTDTAKMRGEDINLYWKWMNQWGDFIRARIQPPTPKPKKKQDEQLFFPDDVLKCPTENMPEKYAATREYVIERLKYDAAFRKFKKNVSNSKFCRQLTLLFGWYVDPNSFRKSMLRAPKRPRKKYV